ncbi:MAG TPA: peptidyl-prolyl cis-trans isomerase [Pirellulales bacterium]|nr:peptidyl-prolyl cis-trans isomerase [Pirellulales bacterium]
MDGLETLGRSTRPHGALLLVLGALGALLAIERLTWDERNVVAVQLPCDGSRAVVPGLVLRIRIGRAPSDEIELSLNDQRTDDANLARLVGDLVRAGGNPPVLLQCDTGAGYRDVKQMLDLLTSLGLHKISIESGREAADAGSGKTSVGDDDMMFDDAMLPDTFDGSEIIAQVGSEVILASDVLADANRQAQKASRRAERPLWGAEIEQARKWYMARCLDELIETKLLVVAGRQSLPREAWEKIESQFGARFDQEYLPKMIEEEGCATAAELDEKLRSDGSSLEIVRRQSLERSLGEHWLHEKTKDDRAITQDEARDYYQAHRANYEAPARARWKHVMVRFDKYSTNKDEARAIIDLVYQQLKAGFEFGKVAEAPRADVVIDDRADHWIESGSLVSQLLDESLFTLPIGRLSEILEDERGVHVIRVMERQEPTITSFTEAEPEICRKIEEARETERKIEYQANLRRTIPVWNLFTETGVEFQAKLLEKPGSPVPSARAEKPIDAQDPKSDPKKLPGRWDLPELYRIDERAEPMPGR